MRGSVRVILRHTHNYSTVLLERSKRLSNADEAMQWAFAGSKLYMAPEMFRHGGQTSKLDVWSVFVKMLWTLDIGGFRQTIMIDNRDGDMGLAVRRGVL